MTLCVMEAATNDAGLEVPVLIFVCKKELKVSYETTKGWLFPEANQDLA